MAWNSNAMGCWLVQKRRFAELERFCGCSKSARFVGIGLLTILDIKLRSRASSIPRPIVLVYASGLLSVWCQATGQKLTENGDPRAENEERNGAGPAQLAHSELNCALQRVHQKERISGGDS